MTNFQDALKVCGFPSASANDLEAWGKLDLTDSATENTELKFGLFGYDITCLSYFCEYDEDSDWCPKLQALGLDGWAFGG